MGKQIFTVNFEGYKKYRRNYDDNIALKPEGSSTNILLLGGKITGNALVSTGQR